MFSVPFFRGFVPGGDVTMKRNRLLVWIGFVASAAGLSGCGGEIINGKCTLDTDCVQGLVCEEGKCAERICVSSQDCGNDSRVCVLIGDKKVCTARECSTEKPCDDPTKECQGGVCVGSEVTPDAMDVIEAGENSGPEVVDETMDPGTPPPPGKDCMPCTDKSECGDGYFCTSVGGDKFCLRECTDDGGCSRGYTCFQASTEGLQCLPVSYKCVPCAHEGCDAGKCCDLVSGICEDCLDECDKCTYGFQCGPGFRCYKTAGNPTGSCVAACGDTGTCPDPAKFTCGDNGKGVMLCVPVNDDICSSCPPEKPYTLPDDTCVECLNSTHCTDPLFPVCDQGSHTCGDQQCPGGSYKCDDGQCHQCCEDDHCAGLGGTDKCENYKCPGVDDPCGDTCADPYPVCVNMDGNWNCGQCDSDDDCIEPCVCTQSFICTDPVTGQAGNCGGPDCPSTCTTPAECPPGAAGETLDCDTSGVCFNPAGGCDGVTSCCGLNQQCFDLMSLLFGGIGGIMPGMPVAMGYCSCSADGDCLGGEPCADMALLCAIPIISDLICAGGSLPAGVPQKMCFDISSLLGGLLP